MAIRKVIEIEWGGTIYRCPNTLEVCNLVELSGINILGLYVTLVQSTFPPTSLCATLMSVLLRNAGANVDPDDIIAEIIHGDRDIGAECRELCILLLPALATETDLKKQDTQSETEATA